MTEGRDNLMFYFLSKVFGCTTEGDRPSKRKIYSIYILPKRVAKTLADIGNESDVLQCERMKTNVIPLILIISGLN